MSRKHFKVDRGLGFVPQASAPSDPSDGDMYYDSGLSQFRKYEGGAWSSLAGLSTTLNDGKIYLGNGSNVATAVTISGDISIDNAGVVAIGAGKVTSTMLAGSIADSKLSTISTSGKVSNSATTATNANTASAIVARDSSGDFSAGTITASLTGTASNAQNAGNMTTTVTTTNASYYPFLGGNVAGGSQTAFIGTGLSFNPSSNTLTTTTFAGALSGNASTATTATNATNVGITDDTSTSATMYPTWVTSTSGNLPQKVSSTKLTFNPSTATLTTTTFSGALSGNASTATTATNATNVATTSTSSNASFFPLFVGSSSNGNQAASLGTGLTFNPSTNNLSTTTFTGALAGNASTATTATTATNSTNAATTATNSTNSTFFPTFVASSSSGNQGIATATGLSFNPSSNTLSTTTFSGALSGNATTATTATNATNTAITDDSSTSATMYPTWVTTTSGNLPQKISSTKLTFNPSTGTLTTTTFSGALSGNASTATTATNATNVATTATNSTNSTFFPTFVGSSSSGNQGIDTASGLSFNPSSNTLTTTTFAGALSGNASTATTATNATNTAITDDSSTSATMYPTWVTTTSGNLPQKISSTKLTFNPSTGTLTTTTVVAALTGTASGNTTYTANNHGVVVSGSGNAMTVVAPGTSGLPLVSGGASADPSYTALGVAGGGTSLTAAGSDGQVLKSMNSTFINSSYVTPYVNYIGNAFAETNTNGWATYADAAANIPVDGTGGSATNLTFSRSTSSPLRGAAHFSIVQSNSSSLQGKGVSYDFTIDAADKANVLSIQFDYNASSTFVASDGITVPLNDNTTSTNAGNSDIEVFIYDVTNSLLIPVSPQVITANGSNNFTFKGVFQAASNSTSYRLMLHVPTTNANATGWTFKYTNVYVGPQKFTQGAPISDWVTFTPTIGATTTPPTFSSKTGFWRRVGDTMEVQMLLFNCSNVGSGIWRFQLPTGYSIDATKLVGATSTLTSGASATGAATQILGNILNSDSPYWDDGLIYYGGSGYVIASMGQQDTSNAVSFTRTYTVGSANNASGNPQGTTTTNMSVKFAVPITGWSSTVQMSNETDNRIVSLSASNNAGSTTSNTAISGWTITKDSHSSFVTGGTYTIPVSGDYFVHFSAATTTGTPIAQIYKNGSLFAKGVGSGVRTSVSVLLPGLVAGDLITPRLDSSLTLTSTATDTLFSLNRLSGSTTIAATDSVNARYYASSTSLSGSLATINWTTKDFDSHGQMSSGTYTITIAGKYQVQSAIAVSGTFALNGTVDMQIQKNGTVVSEDNVIAGGAETSMSANCADLINCIAGDTIRVQVSTSGTGPSIVSSNSKNFFSIVRTGN